MITIKNYEAILRRDITADGWYVLAMKMGYKKYYINLTKQGDMLFKPCELIREPNADGLYYLNCGNEYCTLTKTQLKDMNYLLSCLTTFVS